MLMTAVKCGKLVSNSSSELIDTLSRHRNVTRRDDGFELNQRPHEQSLVRGKFESGRRCMLQWQPRRLLADAADQCRDHWQAGE